jgi:hypothetical protein
MRWVKSAVIKPLTISYLAPKSDRKAIYAYAVELKPKKKKKRNDQADDADEGCRPVMFFDFAMGAFRPLTDIPTESATKKLVWAKGFLVPDAFIAGKKGDEFVIYIIRNDEVITKRAVTVEEEESFELKH